MRPAPPARSGRQRQSAARRRPAGPWRVPHKVHEQHRHSLLFSAEHPELLGLMDIEGRQDTDRLAYIYDEYIAPAMVGTARLLDHLVSEGRIRPIPLHSLHFLIAHGGAAPFTLVPLAEHFDADSSLDARSVQRHAALIADVVVAGLHIDR